jgi:pimeloyl-ACP methyl ester carboxylesterase
MKKTAIYRVPVSGGESIVVDWTAPGGANPVAVFVHGFGSHRRGEKALYFAVRFVDLGWGFLSMDLRGHGDADGAMRDLTLSRLLEDLGAVMDWLPTRTLPLVLIGSSMGAMLAAWHLLRRADSVGGIVMIAPSLRFPAELVENLPEDELASWKQSGVRRIQNGWIDVELGYGLVEDGRQYDPARLVREHRVPTLIFHGMRDLSVDWRQSMRFAEECPCRDIDLVLIKDGDHRLTEHKKLLFDTMMAWWVEQHR